MGTPILVGTDQPNSKTMRFFRSLERWVLVPAPWRGGGADNPAYNKAWFCDTHNVWSENPPYDQQGIAPAQIGDLTECIIGDCRVNVFLSKSSMNSYPVRFVYLPHPVATGDRPAAFFDGKIGYL